MRHGNKTAKLKRTADHRRALLANLTCSLIEHGRIRTTLAKAKALRPVAEKMVTLGKRGDLHARRQALAFLRQKSAVKKLFDEVAPAAANRQGGYCRITKLGLRMTDAAPMAFIEWVDLSETATDAEDETATTSDQKSAQPAAAAATPAPVAEAVEVEEVGEAEAVPAEDATEEE